MEEYKQKLKLGEIDLDDLNLDLDLDLSGDEKKDDKKGAKTDSKKNMKDFLKKSKGGAAAKKKVCDESAHSPLSTRLSQQPHVVLC